MGQPENHKIERTKVDVEQKLPSIFHQTNEKLSTFIAFALSPYRSVYEFPRNWDILEYFLFSRSPPREICTNKKKNNKI